jgi:hypothetical protein
MSRSSADADIVYLVFNDQGGLANLGYDAPPGRTDPDEIIDDIVSGKYDEPRRVVAFNLSEGWARDVSLYVRVACSHRARFERHAGHVAGVELN